MAQDYCPPIKAGIWCFGMSIFCGKLEYAFMANDCVAKPNQTNNTGLLTVVNWSLQDRLRHPYGWFMSRHITHLCVISRYAKANNLWSHCWCSKGVIVTLKLKDIDFISKKPNMRAHSSR